MDLQQYVYERTEDLQNGQRSLYGFSREGSFKKWVLGIERISFASPFSEWIFVTVPTTGSGVSPEHADEQPYGWNGHINDYAAESAVWYAFGLLTETEAQEFMEYHRPEVIFEFVERGHPERLQVRYENGRWIVVDEIEEIGGIGAR